MYTSYRRILQARVFWPPILMGIYSLSSPAQQSTTPPSSDPADPLAATPTNQPLPVKQNLPSSTPDLVAATPHNRLFYVLPNFLTVENAANVPPLSAGDKFKLVAKGCFDIGELTWYGALAGISQAANTDAVYGQGTAGYAKRYAVRFADGTIEDFMTRAVFPSLIHEDPRYYRMGQGTFWHRAGYALSRIVIARTDSGQTRFSYSEIFGSAVAAGISTYTYRPPGERTLSNALTTWGTQVGYDGLSFLLKEFWPDVHRKLRKSGPNP
jgi:hypothetical protein